MCDLSRKIFRCFDLSGNAQLGRLETKCLMDALSSHMKTLTT